MNAIITAALLTQAMQAAVKDFAEEAGVPLEMYQRIVLGPKWRETMKAIRAEILKDHVKKGKGK